MVLQHWDPVTKDHGLIDAPSETVVAALIGWHESLGMVYRRDDVTDSLRSAFERLLPLTPAMTKRLFVPTAAGWTAAFQNGINGSDPFPAMSFLAERLGVRAMRVCHTGLPHPSTIWEVYAPQSLGGIPPMHYRRSLAAARDGKRWVFHDSGAPFAFEDVAAYEQKQIAKRFTKTMLAGYLETGFGLRPFDETFYDVSASSPAIVLDQVAPRSAAREYTLEEVKAGKPWSASAG